ncbi:Bax inhibitor-1/YccA family protein [Cellulomonas edaphi]|uniref:Bax inhibitor-1/YccA family protein n=1 Tax=Cellulomonas edaphi TaxID=3053468 RepID=A0ABT7S531_9CELL|nr:Bax inhibitor-1/YccA family protein [Cellulomons edaphi]MDM7830720.1 Bax inhibitor-1/YccA family protein [Cellulomons edaphi]
MANPVFNNSPVFQDPSARKGNGTTAAPESTIDAVTLEKMYGSPSATARQTGRLTYDDVIMKTGGLLALLVVVAAGSWAVTPQLPWLYWVGAIAGLVLGMVNAFRREPSPALIIAYTVAEGVFVGGISYLFQNWAVPGTVDGTAQPIVLQAVVATIATFAAALFLFRSGKVRVTPKFTKWVLISLVGYVVFSLLNLVLSFFMSSDGFGPLRNGVWGLLAGLFAVGLAAACLIMDFDSIKRGVEKGAPAKFAWSAAFGLIVTLVWLYLEFLRLFAMLSRN